MNIPYCRRRSLTKINLIKPLTFKQGREQEEDQREIACIAQLVRVCPLMQEVPGSIPSVFCSTNLVQFTRFIVTCS